MKERPILFSAPMVRAILDGSKTQTRRVMKRQPRPGTQRVSLLERAIRSMKDAPVLRAWFQEEGTNTSTELTCPYGMPGDRLWVRETWRPADGMNKPGDPATYAADWPDAAVKWKPSIHMPRAASRILLEIVSVRVERLQDIGEGDAIAEGVEPLFTAQERASNPEFANSSGFKNYLWHGLHGHCGMGNAKSDAWHYQYSSYVNARDAYSSLWECINGAESWDANPWVWVVEFKRVKP